MKSEPPHDAEKDQSKRDSIGLGWQCIRGHLRALKGPVDAEIRGYPPPIPACDAHFNHLLEQRSGLSRELVRLDALESEASSGNDPMAALESFLRTSSFIGARALHQIAKALEDRLPDLAQRIAALENSPATGTDVGSSDRSIRPAGH